MALQEASINPLDHERPRRDARLIHALKNISIQRRADRPAQTPRNCITCQRHPIWPSAKSLERTYHPLYQKPNRPNKAKQAQPRHAEQDNLHINDGALRLALVRVAHVDAIEARAQDDAAQRQVAEDPGQHHAAAKPFIVVLLLVGHRHLFRLLGRLLRDQPHLALVRVVEVAVVLRDVDVDLAARLEVGRGEHGGLVVALGAPGDVVRVAEGVDVEDVDVGRGQGEVLEELGGKASATGAKVIGKKEGGSERMRKEEGYARK